MARPKIKRKGVDWKALLMSDEKELLKSAVQEMVQEILEAEDGRNRRCAQRRAHE